MEASVGERVSTFLPRFSHVLAGLQPASSRGRVCDPGKQRKQSTARVANPQQDAGWLQTSLNVGVIVGVIVGIIVGIIVEVNVGERVANPQ